MDYHDLKDGWNQYLDEQFDHKLVLDMDDPLLKGMSNDQLDAFYPGLVITHFLPSVENLSEHWKQRALNMYQNMNLACNIELWEGENNCASTSS